MSNRPVKSAPPIVKVLKPEEVAARLNIAVTTVRRLARRGKLPGFRIGKREWRFNVEQIDLWRLAQTKERNQMSNTETCPRCENRGPAFTIACTVDEAGGGQCRESLSACDFCGGLGIVEIEVADRYRRGHAFRDRRVKKWGLTQAQMAHVLKINPMALNDFERGRAELPAGVDRQLLDEFESRASR